MKKILMVIFGLLLVVNVSFAVAAEDEMAEDAANVEMMDGNYEEYGNEEWYGEEEMMDDENVEEMNETMNETDEGAY